MQIPSHRGNEIADNLAKQGTSEEEDESIEVPFQDLTPLYCDEEWNVTQDKLEFQAKFKGIHYFSNYYKRNRKKCWFKKINADRYFCTLINRLRANHYNLNASLARKNYIASAQCSWSQEGRYRSRGLDMSQLQCAKSQVKTREFVDRQIDNCNIEAIVDIIKREDWDKFNIIYKYLCSLKRII